MLTPEKALEDAKSLVKAYSSTRKYYDALWTLQILYDAGRQWATMAEMQSGNLAVQCLPALVQRTTGMRYRVTFDKIHEMVVKLVAAISPQQIAATPRGSHNLTNTYTRTAKRVQDEVLARIEALSHIREAMLPTHVLGTAGIRMVLRQYGGGRGHGKDQQTLRQYEIDWANIMPWEVIRDPSATTLTPHRDEERIGHEKPRTLGWMKQHYGWAPKPEDVDSTMGDLLAFQDELNAAKGMGTLPGTKAADSQAKGVMVREFYYKDPDKTNQIYSEKGIRVDWPWMFVSWGDPKKGSDGFAPVPTVGKAGLIDNPFCDMPLYFFHFDRMIDGMWAAGVPWRLMQAQDVHNICWTWLIECMQMGVPKWSVQQGTVEGDISNDPWVPIVFKKTQQWTQKPERIPGMQMPQIPAEMVAMTPQAMREALNLADVQFGKGYKRDGSGKAYEALIEQADSVPEERVTTNELTLARLLYATTVDTIRWSTLDQLRRLLGPEVPDEHIRMLLQNDPREHLSGVGVHPSTLRPKTVGQTEEHFVSLVERQVLGPAAAVLETYLQTGTVLDTAMRGAFEKQASELDRILAGDDDVPANIGEHHEHHIKATQLFLDSPRSEDVPPDRMEQIVSHLVSHMVAQQQLMAQASGLGPMEPGPGQASPPADAGNGSFMGTGTAASAGAAVGAA